MMVARRIGLFGLLGLLATSSMATSLAARTPRDREHTQSKISAADAARLLEQASFGPTPAEVTKVQELGVAAYIDQQFALPATGYPGYSYVNHDSNAGCPAGSSNTCIRDNYSAYLVEAQFFRNAITAPDQLRQRVAFALQQIFVASGATIRDAYGTAQYQQMLLDDAFGNFRQLLGDVTLNPAMGTFLNMVRSAKSSPSTGAQPNENFARELMQLFTLGPNLLNADGSFQYDPQGNRIPTYTQENVSTLARVFTGWTFPTIPGRSPAWGNPRYFLRPMLLFANQHDTSEKKLLNGAVLPAGQDGVADLNGALDNIFNHPNVAPFISKQLIQHLVTSNPPASYVARVSAVFNDNGAGVRGDLQAVVRAILLDSVARDVRSVDRNFGKLKDPAQFLAQLFRGAGGASYTDGVYLRGQSSAMWQGVLSHPSVFSFYPPDYPLQGTLLNAPAFAIYNATTSLTRANLVMRLLKGAITADATIPGSTGTYFDVNAWSALAGDTSTLVAQINSVYFHGAMTSTLDSVLTTAINSIPSTDLVSRARYALYIALTSADFQVQR